MKRAVLVNGLPASGKTGVAQGLCAATGWPLLTLDSVKEPFFDELGLGDRAYNRALGRAAFTAIWNVVADAPNGTTAVIDAWFGVKPVAELRAMMARAGVVAAAELWCFAPGRVLAERYRARLGTRHPGHPGADYIPELEARAASVEPLAIAPVLRLDTTEPPDIPAVLGWLGTVLRETGEA